MGCEFCGLHDIRGRCLNCGALSAGEDYSDAKHERKPHGVVIINGQEVASTLQCPHCMRHFVSRKGSGKRRTFCMKCEAVTCGEPACDCCTPWVAEFGMSQHRMV